MRSTSSDSFPRSPRRVADSWMAPPRVVPVDWMGVLIPAQLIPQGRQPAGHVVEHVLNGLELLLHVPVQLLHPLVDAFADAQSRLPQVLADLVQLGLNLLVPGLQLAGVLQLFQQVPKLPDVVNGVAQPLLDGGIVVGIVPQLLQPLLLLRQPLIQPAGRGPPESPPRLPPFPWRRPGRRR